MAEFSLSLDGSLANSRDELGGKAWSINRMLRLGLPVPAAFVLTAEALGACRRGGTLSEAAREELRRAARRLRHDDGRRFGSARRPLLLAVRSGAAVSMPGMMDTVLNVGVTNAVERGLAQETGSRAFAAEVRARFREQFDRVVSPSDGDGDPLSDPYRQLSAAVAAVAGSYYSDRARAYRGRKGLAEDTGTHVIVQAMVFGNRDARSGTGIACSRNPLTGEPALWGEWAGRSQGAQLMAGGLRTAPLSALAEDLPEAHAQLAEAVTRLERDQRRVVEVEFTIDSGRLWLLQFRAARLTPRAEARAAVALALEGVIDRAEAVRRAGGAADAERAAVRVVRPACPPVAAGAGACPGVGSGLVVLDPEEARVRSERGEHVVLARPDSSPDDVVGMLAATAVLTERGGPASHAAVVCRELGRPAVVGCGAATVTTLAGTWVTVDGALGEVWSGRVPVDEAGEHGGPESELLRAWASAEMAPPHAGAFRSGDAGEADEADEDTLLRVVGLKGAVAPDVVASALGVPVEGVGEQLASLRDGGFCDERGGYVRLTEAGRVRSREILAAERSACDAAMLERCHTAFRSHNEAVKQAVTGWQTRAGESEHAGVALDRLGAIHRRLGELFALLGELPLSKRRYPQRLSAALGRAESGERGCVADPRIDSFHTVWFELHQELLDLLGLDRESETG
ncbi:pyruvate, phosphate dikinase [Streptomyces albus subsp. chlorinus]|uniref:pyruvate, phosphate dikinase n=1 Tax=Streptomyces albus TaxID=1888 RepID=UPI00156D8C80|nr:pyruvate, phosphate dikinase [Streptomyces albus]NSC25224.1 pyruvate, phosphate dikinase [Streptomyces albus subsp. chlorinus]